MSKIEALDAHAVALQDLLNAHPGLVFLPNHTDPFPTNAVPVYESVPQDAILPEVYALLTVGPPAGNGSFRLGANQGGRAIDFTITYVASTESSLRKLVDRVHLALIRKKPVVDGWSPDRLKPPLRRWSYANRLDGSGAADDRFMAVETWSFNTRPSGLGE